MKNKKLAIAAAAASVVILFSLVFIFVWQAINKDSGKITVGFDWNFRTTIEEPEHIKVVPGKAYGELPAVEIQNEGTTFVGWNTEADGEGEFITPDTIVPEDRDDHTLYAIWQGNTYTVSYELNGGTVYGSTTMLPQTVTYGEMYGAMVIPNDPEKPHAEFMGWYLNPEGTGVPIAYSSEVRTAEDHTLYAVFRDLRSVYDFTSEDQLEDFINLDHAGMEIVHDGDNSYLKLTPINFEEGTPAKDLYSILMLKTPLKAGQVVEFDCELVGEVVEGWGFWTWGATSTGDIQFDGHVVTAWDTPDLWNNGTFTSATTITENCEGLRIQFRYVGNADAYWKINEIRIKEEGEVTSANTAAVAGRAEYDFATKDQIKDFGKEKNVTFEIVDGYLKVVGTPGSESSLVLNKKLKAGMKVSVDVEYIGDNLAYTDGNAFTFITYGANASGDPDGNTYAVIGNAPWDGAWDGSKVRTVSEITKDCEGLRMQFVMNGDKGAYFKITNIKVYPAGEAVEQLPTSNKPSNSDTTATSTRTEYDFTTADQINDFGNEKNVSYKIVDKYLKVVGTAGSESTLVLNRPLKAGMKVAIDVEYVGNNLAHAAGNAITFLTYGANASGDADGNTYAVMGNAPWDGGWDCAKVRTVSEITKDCEGLRMQFVMNTDANAYFKITKIKIYEAGEEVEVLPVEPEGPGGTEGPEGPVVSTRTEYDFTTSDQINDFGKDKNVSYEIVDDYLKVVGTAGSESTLVFNRQLKAGMKVAVDVEYVGNNLAHAAGNAITFITYGANASGDADGNTYAVMGNAPWDGGWDCAKVRTVSEITTDCEGLRMQFVMNADANAYFKITRIKIYEAGEEVEPLPTEPVVPEGPDVPVINTRTEYDFTTSDQINDFDNDKNVIYEIVDDYLKVVGVAGSESILVLKRELKAGQVVEMDVEYVTNNKTFVNGSNQFTFLAYTANESGDADGKTAAIKGNAPWDGGWDAGNTTVSVDIDQDCAGIRMQFVMNGDSDAYFKITSIRIVSPIEYPTLYDFSDASQLNDFDHDKNVSYEIDGDYLKVVGTVGSESILALKRPLEAGMEVEVDVEYVTNNKTFVNGSNQFTFLAYTANESGDADGKTTAVMGNATWDGGWDAGNTTVSVDVTQDCAGIRMQFVMNSDPDAYFKITEIRIVTPIEYPTLYDFSDASQLNDFDHDKNVSYEIDGDYLKVVGTVGSESILALKRPLEAGMKVEVDVEYVTNNKTFVNGSNQFTFLAYTANESGDADGKTTAVMGNAPWDGGWDAGNTTVSVDVTQDCAGIRMQFVMNSDPDAYFKITEIRIVDEQ